ncbi:MAG: outer membrane beta-barrel protein [Pseudomonadota bacterium]|nr:outer membrane beta-barrel protein [Pseudomonadota bacterium]
MPGGSAHGQEASPGSADEPGAAMPFRLRGTDGRVSVADPGRYDPFSDGPLSREELDGTANAGEGAGSEDDITGAAGGAMAASPGATEEGQAPVDPVSEGQGRVLPVAPEPQVLDPVNAADMPSTRANVRVSPVEPGTRRPEQEDPFLPAGFRAGTWQVFTRLEQAIGYATNNTFAAGGRPGAFTQTDANVTMRSDWSRHEAQIEADGTLQRAFGGGSTDTGYIPEAGINGRLRLDLVDGFTTTLRGNYDYSTEALSSTSLATGTAERPGVHAYGGSAELARTGGRLDLSLRGSADRVTYEDAVLADGSTASQRDRNNTLYQLTARAAYGPTPSVKPFVQGGLGWRVYDEEEDRNGENRSSVIMDIRAGFQLELREKLTGELAVGYAREAFASDTLDPLDAVTINGTLDWSPERDTQVTATASTSFGGPTTAGANGSVNYQLLAEAVRRVRDNLAVNATASYSQTVYDYFDGSDHSYMVGAGIEYWISRYLSLTADVEHEWFDSATRGSSWESTSVRMGVALQR